jgi:apolipoprotein N-acyltransferase
MRLSTVDLQKRLNPDKPKGLHMGLTVLIAWLAGAAFILALAPYGIWPVALVSPAILYALLVPAMTGRRAFLIGQAYRAVVCWSILAIHLDTRLWRYTRMACADYDCAYGSGHGFVPWLFGVHL